MKRQNGAQARVAVVIGGARGIGLACALALAAQDWRVVVADRDAIDPDDDAREAAGQLAAERVDVTDSASVNALFTRIGNAHGGLDGLVNAAGFNRHQSVEALDDATWREQFDVHLGGTLRACRAALPLLRVRGGGVVNFSSVAAQRGRPMRAPYSAAKAGIEALTRTLAIEWAPHAIRVNAVVPGWIDTRMVRQNLAAGRSKLESLVAAIPLRRLGRAAEVASVVAFLLSDASSYMTGQALVIDGGALINGDW